MPGGVVVLDSGVISTSGDLPLETRIHWIYDEVRRLLEAHSPIMLVLEDLYAEYRFPRTALLMAHARGVIFLSAAQHGIPVVSYNASRIKKTITGHGRASKEQVQYTILRELRLAQLPEPPDVADALAVALTHYHLSVARAGGPATDPGPRTTDEPDE